MYEYVLDTLLIRSSMGIACFFLLCSKHGDGIIWSSGQTPLARRS